MKNIILSSLILSSLILCISCNKDNPIPPDQQPQISLTLEDVSCTEAWIKLTTANISLPVFIEIQKDNNIIKTISLASQDTLLYLDSLLPNKTYDFTSLIHTPDGSIKSSAPATTMDTTSHNFTWQTWTFGGEAGSCTLYDVAIINENDIWAVGEIYLLDTLGQPDPQAYGIARWDGQGWSLKKLFYNNNIPITPRSILIINPNNIYLASGSIFHWDGVSSTVQLVYSRFNLSDPNATIKKLWGNSEMLYGVGDAGTIVSYQNGQWSRIESGTDLNIQDIYGAYDNKTHNYEILAVASDGWNEKILQINNAGIITLQDSGLSKDLHSMWFEPEKRYYIVGAGIFQKHSLKDSVWTVYPPGVVTNYYSGSIDGNGINDLFVTGAFFEVVHFNGANWFSYRDIFPIENGTFGKVAIKSNLAIMVGFKNQQAIIAVGIR